MPAVYENLGIHFLYPDNWTLDEQEAVAGNRSVTVYSPGGSFWSITLYPGIAEPAELAATAMQALKSEYPGAEAEPADEQMGEQELRGYDVSFFYLDLTITALIRALRLQDASCLILCQAEDRDFEQLAAVFQAITTSLLSSEVSR